MNKLKLTVFILTIGFVSLAIADEIPLENIPTPAQQRSSLEQRVDRLEQQMKYTTHMNLPMQIERLQQQMQKLQGELDTEQHAMQSLTKQLHDFYQDLDKRISQPKALAKKTTTTQNHAAIDTELQTYQTAFNLVRNKQYDTAILKMRNYLNHYPKGKYVSNTHYWLGEIYYLQSQLEKSINEFQIVINQYPTSAKVPDSMLKLAMIYSAQGNYQKSHQEFQKIKNKYPDSTAAKLIAHQTHKKG